ncbi:MAG: HEAT repeat domain-containing protein [Phycisphaerales bacterium JB043]
MGWTPASAILCGTAALAVSVGCRVSMRAGFDSPDPQERAIALARSLESEDPRTIPELIRSLDSSDPVARLMAIKALEKRTDETFGYRHYDPPWVREEAIERWAQWWRSQQEETDAEQVTAPEPE